MEIISNFRINNSNWKYVENLTSFSVTSSSSFKPTLTDLVISSAVEPSGMVGFLPARSHNLAWWWIRGILPTSLPSWGCPEFWQARGQETLTDCSGSGLLVTTWTSWCRTSTLHWMRQLGPIVAASLQPPGERWSSLNMESCNKDCISGLEKAVQVHQQPAPCRAEDEWWQQQQCG